MVKKHLTPMLENPSKQSLNNNAWNEIDPSTGREKERDRDIKGQAIRSKGRNNGQKKEKRDEVEKGN